jgi:geranylgeranyl diphosphate synthase type I
VYQPLASSSTATLSPSKEQFAGLLESFRARVDRELEGFLADKRRLDLGGDGHAGDLRGARGGDQPAADGTAAAGRAARGPLGEPADLVDGIARLVGQGGKRLRPALVYYTYRACGGRADEQVMPLALSTELLHTYLLIHDDIMDHAELRRGQPAAHIRFGSLHREAGLRGDADDFGRSTAILLGDLAQTYAVELFARSTTAAGTPAARELSRCFSAMCEEVIGGQYLELLLAHRDLAAADAGSSGATAGAVGEAELLRILRLKSGRYSAERPIQLGALLAGAAPAVRAELSRYGSVVGEAFQLQDDILGMFGDPATVGKPVGDDLREGKFTFLIHHALRTASAADRATIIGMLGRQDLSASDVAVAQQAFERSGARHAVAAMIATRLDEARRALAALDAIDAVNPLDAAPAPTHGAPTADQTAHASADDGRQFLAGLLDYLAERDQ